MARTKTESALEAAELEHAADPERAELLRRARRFKSSWVELAESLTEAKRSHRYRDWGYESLEQYARAELHLRQETVDKLTGSFSFLRRKAPDVLARDGVKAPIPSYQAVDFLRRAEAQEGAPPDAVAAIRKRVIDEGAGASSVSREYGKVVFPIDWATRKQQDEAALKNVAKRLHELVAETRVVPKKLAADVSSALERLLAALDSSNEDEARPTQSR